MAQLEHDGWKLSYSDTGGDGPPVILIHGGRDHARSWDDIAIGLADRHRVIVPELAGHGDLTVRRLAPTAIELELIAGDDLVVEAQRVQDQNVLAGADRNQVLTVVEAEAADARPLALSERLVQEAERVLGVT